MSIKFLPPSCLFHANLKQYKGTITPNFNDNNLISYGFPFKVTVVVFFFHFDWTVAVVCPFSFIVIDSKSTISQALNSERLKGKWV
jgi:hypothetical protein